MNIANVLSESKRERFRPSRKLKICHLVATVEGGRWCFEQLRELRDRYGHDVTAILSGTEGSLPDLCADAGIRVLTAEFNLVGSHGKGFMRSWPAKVKALSDLLLQERFDVVQTHVLTTMLFGRTAAWLADVPVRLSMIAGPFHLMAYTTRWLDAWTAWMETGLIPSCRLSHDLCRAMGVPERKLALIYYGPDQTRFDPATVSPAGLRQKMGWDADTPIVTMVAYFYPRMVNTSWIPVAVKGKGAKGHEELIRAAAVVIRQFPQTKFVLVGKGWGPTGEQFMEEMRALVTELDLGNSVFFLGGRDDVPSIYRDTTIAVQVPLNENLGGSIEALLMERPLVATRVGGLVDAVRDGETGILVQPGNPASLAEGILKLLRDPEMAARLGKQGRAFTLEKFTLDTSVDELAAFYERQSQTVKPGYRSWPRALRYGLGGALFGVLAFRYLLVDNLMLQRLPSAIRAAKARLARHMRRVQSHLFPG